MKWSHADKHSQGVVLFSMVLGGILRASVASADMACAGDAFRFCGTDLPDQTRVKSCLLRNIRNLQAARVPRSIPRRPQCSLLLSAQA